MEEKNFYIYYQYQLAVFENVKTSYPDVTWFCRFTAKDYDLGIDFDYVGFMKITNSEFLKQVFKIDHSTISKTTCNRGCTIYYASAENEEENYTKHLNLLPCRCRVPSECFIGFKNYFERFETQLDEVFENLRNWEPKLINVIFYYYKPKEIVFD